MMKSLKQNLCKACEDFVVQKENSILGIIKSNQEALDSETKSSAGDKHETGRAMLQLEMEKVSKQLHAVHEMKTTLRRIDITKTTTTVNLGSIIVSDAGQYFLSISAGELSIDNSLYYAVSANSPIGRLMLGAKAGDKINFRKEITILEVH